MRRPAAMRGGDLTDSQLLQIIRRSAFAGRTAKTRSFHPLRDSATQLKVPVSAILRVYGLLKKEGVLATMRGSKTQLQGRRTGRRLHIKSFIGLAVSYSCFMTLQDYRRFYLELRREAQLRGFVSNLFFYQDNPEGLEDFSKAIEEFGIDSVIWFLPRVSVRDTILRLRDNGIPVLGVSDGGSPGITCRYEIHREKALSAILRRWRSDAGLDSMIVARASRRSPADEETIQHAADKAGFSYDYVNIPENEIEHTIATLRERTDKGIILPAAPAALFSLRVPQAFNRLLKSCRVALSDGPITTMLGSIPDGPIDLITVDWRSVAKKIVGDVVRKRAFKETAATVFEATPRLRVQLRRYAETI